VTTDARSFLRFENIAGTLIGYSESEGLDISPFQIATREEGIEHIEHSLKLRGTQVVAQIVRYYHRFRGFLYK
jgi:hypothetical protein